MKTETENNVTKLPSPASKPATEPPGNLPTVHGPRLAPAANIFSDPVMFEHYQRVANVFASSELVPPHMRNVANCLIALDIGNRLNEQPLTVMQNIYVVSGRPGWKTEYVIARANRSGVFSSRITWTVEGEGRDLSVTARATLADTGEIVEATCDMAMAEAEGWVRNTKYKSMPSHMLKWRSAAFLIRLYAPEIMLGIPVLEEVETLPEVMRDVTPPTQAMQDALDEFGAAPKPTDALDEFAGDGQPADGKPSVQNLAARMAEIGKDAHDNGAARDKAVPAEYATAENKELGDMILAAYDAAAAEFNKKAGAGKSADGKKAKNETKAKAKAEPEAAAGGTELDDPADPPAGDAQKAPPKNVEQYIEMLKAHVETATDPAALKAWFLSKEQKDLRGVCGVIGDDLETVKNITLAKIGDLQSKGK